jgi:calnexin
MQNDILFDNIYIGHSISDAEKLAKDTFEVKKAVEVAQEEADKPKKDETDTPKSSSDLSFMDDPVTYAKQKVNLFAAIAQRDPIEAIKFVPEVAAGIAIGFVTLLFVLLGLFTGGAAAAPSKEQIKTGAQQAKAKVNETKDQVTEAVASGTEKVKVEANKRNTRST